MRRKARALELSTVALSSSPLPYPPPTGPKPDQDETESGAFLYCFHAFCVACAGLVAVREGRDCSLWWWPRAVSSAWYAFAACPLLPVTSYFRLLPSAAGYCQGSGGRDGRDGWPAANCSCRLLLQLLLLACRCLYCLRLVGAG